jgi:hypothetical protein
MPAEHRLPLRGRERDGLRIAKLTVAAKVVG